MATITTAQAETIYDIFEGGWRMEDFMPLQVFPTNTAADTAKVRACMSLVKKELIKRVPIALHDDRPHFQDSDGHYRLALTEDAIKAFYEYAEACDYVFPWRTP